MPSTIYGLTYDQILNLVFALIIVIGMLIGFILGFKKSMFHIVRRASFLLIYIFTLNFVVNYLWTFQTDLIGQQLGAYFSVASSAKSFSEALPLIVSQYLPSNFANLLDIEQVNTLLNGIGMFVFKIAYTILYFTVINFIYFILFLLIRIIFFPDRGKLSKYQSKNRGMGAFVGIFDGAVNVVLLMILLGGVISIAGSLSQITALSENQETTVELEFPRQSIYQASRTIIPLASTSSLIPDNVANILDYVNVVVDTYESNDVVSLVDQITIKEDATTEELPITLYTFDAILSFDYEDDQIAFRKELTYISQLAGIVINSEFATSKELTDITPEEINAVFTTISQSVLLTDLIPVAIEAGTVMYEIDLELPIEDVYEIDWSTEIVELGNVATSVFTLLNSSGALADLNNIDYETISLDPDLVRDIFDGLSDSKLVTLAAYVAVKPLLESQAESVKAVITIPADLDWSKEIKAIGEIAGQVLDTGISLQVLKSANVGEIIKTLTSFDFTVLLESDILSNAMINVLQGDVSESIKDFIIIPSDIVWIDVYNDQGELSEAGELRNILLALNNLSNFISENNFDFENPSIEQISNLDTDSINTIFESKILVASLTNYVKNLDLDFSLVFPDSAFDEDGYFQKTELQNLVSAVGVVFEHLMCEAGDESCTETGFDFQAALTLADEDIDTLLSSKILEATLGDLIITTLGNSITIPSSAKTVIFVEEVEKSVVSSTEIKKIFKAVSALGITDFENFTFDFTLLENLGTFEDVTVLDETKSDKILASDILVATITHYLMDDTITDGLVEVPYLAEDESPILLSDTDGTLMVSRDELENILRGLLVLQIDDISNMENFDLSVLTDNVTTLLQSSILQATISTQVFNLASDLILIPYYDENDEPIRITVGENETAFTYIKKAELEHVFEGLSVLNITDIESFDGEIDLSVLMQDENISTLLSSSILQASVSKQILDLTNDGYIIVPYIAYDQSTPIQIVVGTGEESTQYIKKAEIEAVVSALNVLEINDITTFTGTVDLSKLSEGNNSTVVLSSAIIHATISKQLMDLDDDGTISIPAFKEDNSTSLFVESGEALTQTTYLLKSELEAIFAALDILNIGDVSQFSGAVDLSFLSVPGNAHILVSSSIIQATISKQVIDLESSNTLEIPYVQEDNSSLLRIMVGPITNQTEYIASSELEAILDALNVFGITDVTNFSGTIDFTKLTEEGNSEIILASSIIQATFSKQILDLDQTGTLDVPYIADDLTTEIRVMVSYLGHDFEYVHKQELIHIIDALDVLEMDNIDSFSGSVDLSLLAQPENAEIVVASSVIQATISKQVLDLNAAGTVVVPTYQDDNTTEVTITAGSGLEVTQYVSKTELKALILALNKLEILDVQNYTGSVDLTKIYGEENQTVLLGSSIMQATISKTMIDLGSAILVVPYVNPEDFEVRLEIGPVGQIVEMITKDEIKSIINVLEILSITDVSNFGGTIDLALFSNQANKDVLLSSASIQATISKQLIDLGDAILVVPTEDIENNLIREIVGEVGYATEYVSSSEISHILDALNQLHITDITSFEGSIDLNYVYGETNQTIILSSASMHATISKQLLDLGTEVLMIPSTDVDDHIIQTTIQSVLFITKDEIKAIINNLDLLDIEDIDGFSGTVDLSKFATASAQTTLLSSASMHATISKQLYDLRLTVLTLPETDIDHTYISLSVSSNFFVTKNEIKSLIDAMNVLGITDITSYTGAFDLTKINTPEKQNTLLLSAIMHATISTKLLGLSDDVLIVPHYTTLGEVAGQEIRITQETTEFVIKSEIKAIIKAFNQMGLDDLDTIGSSIDSSKFFTDKETLLLSYSIHATISNRMITGTNDKLIVPNTSYGGSVQIRINHSDVTYIAKTEMIAILDALKELNLTDFGNINISPTNLFNKDFDLILTSYSMQATISDVLLSGALDDSAPIGSMKLIVPNYYRETISVGIATKIQVEGTELYKLIEGLQVLNVSDFNGGLSANTITSLSDENLNTILLSGSLHVSVDNMIKGNSNVNGQIPTLALADLYGMNGILITSEILAFKNAAQILSSTGNISDVSVTMTAFNAVSDPNDRDVCLDSMIVRNILTDELEDMMTLDDPIDTYWPADDKYMNNDNTTFLTKAGVYEVLNHYGL